MDIKAKLLLTDADWEKINRKCGNDVMDIVVNLDGRYTKGQQADMIVERCNEIAKAQLAKCEPLIRNDERERVLKEMGCK